MLDQGSGIIIYTTNPIAMRPSCQSKALRIHAAPFKGCEENFHKWFPCGLTPRSKRRITAVLSAATADLGYSKVSRSSLKHIFETFVDDCGESWHRDAAARSGKRSRNSCLHWPPLPQQPRGPAQSNGFGSCLRLHVKDACMTYRHCYMVIAMASMPLCPAPATRWKCLLMIRR